MLLILEHLLHQVELSLHQTSGRESAVDVNELTRFLRLREFGSQESLLEVLDLV